jgi:hypothetical protein
MAFLNDLDGVAWIATFAAMVVCGWVTFLNLRDRRNDWKPEKSGEPSLTGLLGVFCLVGAALSFSPNANAPRKSIEGIVHLVAKVDGKSFTEYICATSCQLTGGYALALDGRAARVVRIGSTYRFTYLEHPSGNVYSGTSLRVVAIFDNQSGNVLYARDLTNHPFRIAVYLLDALLLFGALALPFALQHKASHSNSEDENSGDEDPPPDSPIPISLGLDSNDKR